MYKFFQMIPNNIAEEASYNKHCTIKLPHKQMSVIISRLRLTPKYLYSKLTI